MEIMSNEETFTYSLEVSYLKDDFYKVTLVNQTNNHEQIILKNTQGVYVVTPSLNKSFKFQSEWPSSSSQSYILASLLNDIKNDSEATVEEENNSYVIKTKVNYPNNSELTYQKVYFDKNMNLERVNVYNSEDVSCIKVMFSSLDLKANLSEEDFALENLIDTSLNKEPNNSTKPENSSNNTNTNNNVNNNSQNNSENNSANTTTNNTQENTTSDYSVQPSNQTSSLKDDNTTCTNKECDSSSSSILDSIIYPLYIPSETYLSNSEKINTDDGNRVILTFAGDKNFVLIEEAATVSSEFEIIPVYGDPVMLSDTIAAKSANSMYWTSNNISYYLTSSDLSTEEMVTIAQSLGNATTVANTK